MEADLFPHVERGRGLPLAAQIHASLRAAILDGRLAAGTRLPSWRDLSAQLGVARGTVRAAYERLEDEQLVRGEGAAGTRVIWPGGAAAPAAPRLEAPEASGPLAMYPAFDMPARVFQMGVPAGDAFPAVLWSRLAVRAARQAAALPSVYPDPRGEPALRQALALYLGLARGLRCAPAQILVTAGYAGALDLTLRLLALQGERREAWIEDPGFPLTRHALRLGGFRPVPVPVDAEGLDVAAGCRRAPGAALAVVTAGQQSPLGVTLSLPRRMALLDWAQASDGWILEDDYLGELQLKGRAASALAALDGRRTFYAGTFSKTVSPSLRLGFLVVPAGLVSAAGELAACLIPAPAAGIQLAMAAFLGEGHFLRHLRRMKRLYASRRERLLTALREAGLTDIHPGGLAVRVGLPPGTDDVAIARRALAAGLAPAPLSPWHVEAPMRPGLLLGAATTMPARLDSDCARLAELIG